jgi:hypothetical protein
MSSPLAASGYRARLFGAEQRWDVNWRRLGRRAGLLMIPALAVEQLVDNAVGSGIYGGDFHGGIWPAGSAVLHGNSPYPAADPHRLLILMHAFVTPPPLAILAAPFSLLPFSAAIALWNLVCVVALCAALRVMGIRDKRIYLLALCSFPFWESLENGQPDGLFALAAALTWRYRDSWPGAVAAAALIAAKLFAWPLVIWMLVTRRFRSLKITVGATLLILLGSWAVIGFRGLAQYPNLVAADAKAFETFPLSNSLVEALSSLGLSTGATRALAVAVALALSAVIVIRARRSDEGWFAAALTFGVLSSPVVWFHYVVVLFVPLAFARRRAIVLWAAVSYSFWFILIFLHTAEGRAVALAGITVCSVAWATMKPRAAAEVRRERHGSDRRVASRRKRTGTGPAHRGLAVSATNRFSMTDRRVAIADRRVA